LDGGVDAAFASQYRAKLDAAETDAIAAGLDRFERAEAILAAGPI
jgi:hypothetical protein